jgi:hypothetical protein
VRKKKQHGWGAKQICFGDISRRSCILELDPVYPQWPELDPVYPQWPDLDPVYPQWPDLDPVDLQ